MKNLIFVLLLLLVCSHVQSQTARFVDIAYIKSTSPDFIQSEKETWLNIHKQLIREGRKAAWYMYRVKYPAGSEKEYDYVRFNVFTDWKQVEAPYAGLNEIIKKVYPNGDPQEIIRKNQQSRELVWTQVFQVIDEAANKVKQPSKFIVLNEMRTVPGSEGEYVKLEVTYFKPFHVERIARGIMNNWSLYKPYLPYGTKYESDYVTMNGYNTWEDITKNNPPDVWAKVHGNVNFNEIHDKILSKRITVNNELWELVAFVAE